MHHRLSITQFTSIGSPYHCGIAIVLVTVTPRAPFLRLIPR